MKIAVVGAGIAGIAAADRLSKTNDVRLYESKGRLGGHTDSQSVMLGERIYSIDTGFVVFNEDHYPQFSNWLNDLQVSSRRAPMSFSYECSKSRISYATASLKSLFAQRGSLFSIEHLRMIANMRHFFRNAERLIHASGDQPIGEFLAVAGYGKRFIDCYVAPICSALWSYDKDDALAMPLRHVIGFMQNNRLMSVGKAPQWRVITGGSSRYVEAFEKQFTGSIHLDSEPLLVRRGEGSPQLHDALGWQDFDAIVLACPPDQVLQLLDDATATEADILNSFRYRENRVVLHSDERYMPSAKDLWSSWNALAEEEGANPSVTYWMNQLQSIRGQNFFITNNPCQDPVRIWAERKYRHTLFDKNTLDAQAKLERIDSKDGVFFCGAYRGYGLHEDGFKSGIDAAEKVLRAGLADAVVSKPQAVGGR